VIEETMVQDKWLTIDELSEYLKMGRTKLYRMTQDGDIPASKVGNQWRFDREEIDEWMKNQRPAAYSKNRKGDSR
jgi:excisionase family DNA binding protein